MKDKYLTNYYKNNNPVLDRLKIKRRLLMRILTFAICSIIYYLIMLFPNYTKFSGEITISEKLVPLKYIMAASAIISIIGFLVIILAILFKEKFNKIFDKIEYHTKHGLYVLLDWLSILPVCVVITVVLFSYCFIITPVSGTSMTPTIQDNEHVLVQYNKEIKHGTVVVLEVNKEDNFKIDSTNYYIKRVIGLPGDSVRWTTNKQLYINDQLVSEDYFPDDYLKNLYTEAFDGFFTYIDEFGIEVTKEDKVSVIPEGYYFVMGDNRSIGGSHDSRHIGLIKEENIVGVATYHMLYIIPRGKIE